MQTKQWIKVAAIAVVIGFLVSKYYAKPTATVGAISEQDLHAIAQTFLLPKTELPTADERALADLGEAFFHESRFSSSQKVSCATCHRPALDFQDGKQFAVGETTGTKNTPSIINARYGSWFFWDGRSTNLIDQALGPLFSHTEHFSNYGQLARVVFKNHKTAYENLFGRWPAALTVTALQRDLLPLGPKPKVPGSTIIAYVLKHLPSTAQKAILAEAADEKIQPIKVLRKKLGPTKLPKPYRKVLSTWKEQRSKTDEQTLAALKQVAQNIARAIAYFEMQVVTGLSPFDKFVKRFGASTPAQDAFGEGFGAEEYEGYKLFVGKAQCMLCHMGPMFMDQSFHNLGIGQIHTSTELWDAGILGRTSALHALPPRVDASKSDLPLCIQEKLPADAVDACETLAALDHNNLQMVGAYKTPSLRNAAKHSPHFHDGSARSLLDVIEHYNKPPQSGGIGRTEETLRPLGLSEKEKIELVAFLRSLSSETRLLHRE